MVPDCTHTVWAVTAAVVFWEHASNSSTVTRNYLGVGDRIGTQTSAVSPTTAKQQAHVLIVHNLPRLLSLPWHSEKSIVAAQCAAVTTAGNGTAI